MCWTYEGSYTDPNFRDGCDFLLYTEDELKEIIEMDREAERLWNPPPQILSTLAELCERVRRTGTTEQPLAGVIYSTEENPSVGNPSIEAGQASIEN